MIQSVKKEFEEELSFGEICARASKEKIGSVVDCNADCFFAPKSMIRAVQTFCGYRTADSENRGGDSGCCL